MHMRAFATGYFVEIHQHFARRFFARRDDVEQPDRLSRAPVISRQPRWEDARLDPLADFGIHFI